MLSRSLQLEGFTYGKDEKTGAGIIVPKDGAVKEFLKTLASINPDPKVQADIMVKAWEDGSGALQKSLNALRVEAVGNFIAAERGTVVHQRDWPGNAHRRDGRRWFS